MAITTQYFIIIASPTPGVTTGTFLQNNGSWGLPTADPKIFSSKESALVYIDENLAVGKYLIKDQIIKS